MLITSGDLFKAALRKCGGAIAEGESPSADLMEDTRMAFNVMLDSWSAERLSVYSTQEQIFTWPANTISRTLGPTGGFVGDRPVGVDDSSYFKDPGSGVSYGMKIINQEQYNGIALKTATSTFPQLMWLNMDVPNISIYLYPVPNRDLEFHFVSVKELTQVDDLFTNIVFPPGYQRAFIFNLAVEVCMELGLEPPRTVQRIAMASKRTLKSNNFAGDIMSMPFSILGKRQRFNIFSGNY